MLESGDNSECLQKLLKFPSVDIDNLIKSAIDLKVRYLRMKKLKGKGKAEIKSKGDWISTSIVFFNRLPKTSVPIKDLKSVIEVSNTVIPVKYSVFDKLEKCIQILEKEKERHNSKKMDGCIKKLKEVFKKLK